MECPDLGLSRVGAQEAMVDTADSCSLKRFYFLPSLS